MKTDLKNKLKNCLELQNIEERDVVYILVEISKIVEHTETFKQYKSLWFYRHWATHSKINKQTQFVKELRERFKNIHSRAEIATTKIYGFVSFFELRNEMIRFFHQQVETNLIPSKMFLKSFLGALTKVITDVPITIKLENDTNDTIEIIFDDKRELKIKGPGNYMGSVKILESLS